MKNLLNKFFKDLGLLEPIGELIEPSIDKKMGEKEMGCMSLLERNLYSLMQKPEMSEIEDLLNEMMWVSIYRRCRSKMSEGSVGLGIRRGFEVVEYYYLPPED